MKNEIWNMKYQNEKWNMKYEISKWNMKYEIWKMIFELSECSSLLQNALAC